MGGVSEIGRWDGWSEWDRKVGCRWIEWDRKVGCRWIGWDRKVDGWSESGIERWDG